MKDGYSTEPAASMAHGVYKFAGPGMPQYANTVWLEADNPRHQAERVARLLALAFEAGKEAARAEIRAAIGVR